MAEIKIPRYKYTPPEGEKLNMDKVLMNYESPIEVISKRMRTEVEDSIFNAILDLGISVDKEELIKALQYDREQYEKGFNDGCIGATKEIKRETAREVLKEVRQALLNMVLANSMGETYDIEKRFAEIEHKYTGGE